jgi:hypothetical protein
VFQGFSKAKFTNGGSNLSSSQFSILPQLAQKMKLTSKVVKIDPKIIISLPKILIPETHCSYHFDLTQCDNNYQMATLTGSFWDNFSQKNPLITLGGFYCDTIL